MADDPEPWVFSVPPVSDLDGDPAAVTLQVITNEKKLFYDSSKNIIEQVTFTDPSSNVKFILKDDQGLQNIIDTKVEFVCLPDTIEDEIVYNYDVPAPKAKIVKIEMSGKVIVKFDQQMVIPGNITNILTDTTIVKGQEYPSFQVTVLPGPFSDPENLKFTYNITKFEEDTLELQLNFETPIGVSILS